MEFIKSRINKIEYHLKERIINNGSWGEGFVNEVGSKQLQAYFKGKNYHTQALWYQGVGSAAVFLVWSKYQINYFYRYVCKEKIMEIIFGII